MAKTKPYHQHMKDRCEACSHDGSFYPLDPDHVRTRGSLGGDDDQNIMTLCRKCHTEKGMKGISYMATKYPNYHAWLKNNGWFFCNFMKKWRK